MMRKAQRIADIQQQCIVKNGEDMDMIFSDRYQNYIRRYAYMLNAGIAIKEGVFLISGATGLIGSVLVDCLMQMNEEHKTGFKVIALSRNPETAKERFCRYWEQNDFQHVVCDVNCAIPEVGDVDYVIHAASNTHPLAYSQDPIGTIKTNVIGTDFLLQYTRTHNGKRFVFLSSVEIYGECGEGQESFREQDLGYIDCNQLRAGYPESKRVGESLCCAYQSQFGMDIVIPRLCRVYGPTMRQDDSKALAQFMKKAIAKENIVLKSDGQQYYSYIHVLDAVSAIMLVLDKGKKGEAYNVSSQKSNVKLCELADKLAKLAGTQVIFEMPDRTEQQGYSKATRAILDSTKIEHLGWHAELDIDSGLQMTLQIMDEAIREKQ